MTKLVLVRNSSNLHQIW